MKCAVENCNNDSVIHTELNFFLFPRNRMIADQWLSFCGSHNRILKTKAVVCSEHFKANDIIGGSLAEIGLFYKTRLKPGAVPCLKKSNVTKPQTKKVLSKLLSKDNTKKILDTEMKIEEPEEEPVEEPQDDADEPQEEALLAVIKKEDDYLDMESSEAVIDELNNEIDSLRNMNMRLDVSMQVAQKNSNARIKLLQKSLDEANMRMTMLEQELEMMLNNNQINRLKKKIAIQCKNKPKK